MFARDPFHRDAPFHPANQGNCVASLALIQFFERRTGKGLHLASMNIIETQKLTSFGVALSPTAVLIALGMACLWIACSTPSTQKRANAKPSQSTALTASTENTASGNLPLRTLADVPLTGGTTRLDYQSLDSSSGRLYIAHLGSDLMTVFDVNKQTIVADVKDLKRVHGMLAGS